MAVSRLGVPGAIAALIPVLLAIAGCAERAPEPAQLIGPAELTRLVSGSTLLVERSRTWPYQTLIYLDPAGTGWYDSGLIAGTPPDVADMAAVLSWRITEPSRICLWTSPMVGQMSSNAPAFRDCLRVVRSAKVPGQLDATVVREDDAVTMPMLLRGGNAFPATRTAQYQEQVRAMFGGEIPVWPIP